MVLSFNYKVQVCTLPCKIHPVTKFLIIGLVLSFYMILKGEYLWLNVSPCKPCEVLQIFGLMYLMKERISL